jgi:hypothetical protein
MTDTSLLTAEQPATPSGRHLRVRRSALYSLFSTLSAGLILCLLAALSPAVSQSQAAGVSSLARPKCSVTSKLVPSCGRWFGVAPLAHTGTQTTSALSTEEAFANRAMDIVHTYHTNGQLFPTAEERKLGEQKGRNRLLLINWKPATDLSWRQVAQGAADSRIDKEAAYLKSTFRHHFFLAIWHEPENDVNTNPSSGKTATDYSAMYRHVVSRLRSDGVTWATTVMNYMGYDKWAEQSWFNQLWPGSAYVDWIGIDPYGHGPTSQSHDFSSLINRPEKSFPGFYTWATTVHKGKPIMLAEWGVEATASAPSGQAQFFNSMGTQLNKYPAVKALVYFDMPKPPAGEPRTYLAAESSTSLDAYRKLDRRSNVVAPGIHYAN